MRLILGKPMIQHLFDRVLMARSLDLVAIATSTDITDDPLAKFAKEIELPCYRGSLDNVMERIQTAADAFKCDTIVEILGDNPLVHSDLIDDLVVIYKRDKLDYAANITEEYPHVDPQLKRFPLGIRVQVYRAELAKQWRNYPEFFNKDLGTTAYIYRNPNEFQCGYCDATGKWTGLNKADYHFAVNYQKNFELIEKIFSGLYPEDSNFSLLQVMAFMQNHPELESLMGAD